MLWNGGKLWLRSVLLCCLLLLKRPANLAPRASGDEYRPLGVLSHCLLRAMQPHLLCQSSPFLLSGLSFAVLGMPWRKRMIWLRSCPSRLGQLPFKKTCSAF